MSVQLIENQEDLEHLVQTVRGKDRLAIDLEAAGFHRYSDKVCLLQITSDDQTFLVDTLSVDPSDSLRPIFQNPDTVLVLHGGVFDLRLLQRDLRIFPVQLFDTQIAASLVGEPSLGLAALLSKHLNIDLSKKYQRADWAKRPLSKEMLAYAAADTQHLNVLCDILTKQLDILHRSSWVAEECSALSKLRWEPETESDPVLKIKGSKHLSNRELERLRGICEWRDTIAKNIDRAHFRVAGDPVLLEIAKLQSNQLSAIGRIKGMSDKILIKFGKTLIKRLERIDNLPAEQWMGYPTQKGPRRHRLSNKEERTLEQLKVIRNKAADRLKIARGSIMSNSLLSHIATIQVDHSADLLQIDGVRNWHIEALGNDILDALKD